MAFTTDYGSMMAESSDFRKFVDSYRVRSRVEKCGKTGVKLVKEGDQRFLAGFGEDEKLFEIIGQDGSLSLVPM